MRRPRTAMPPLSCGPLSRLRPARAPEKGHRPRRSPCRRLTSLSEMNRHSIYRRIHRVAFGASGCFDRYDYGLVILQKVMQTASKAIFCCERPPLATRPLMSAAADHGRFIYTSTSYDGCAYTGKSVQMCLSKNPSLLSSHMFPSGWAPPTRSRTTVRFT